jgi:hypothetical protein
VPDRRDDVAFGFDPRPFLSGLSQVQKGMGELTKRVTGMAGQLTHKMLAWGASIFGLRAVIRSVGSAVPEIGQSFKIAGEIFTKNFFWPLRQAVMPLLMKLLDWVRTHRATFVKWGAAVAGIFKVIVAGVKQFRDILKHVVDVIGPAFKNVFGGGAADFFNLVALKLAFVVQLAGRLVQAIAEWVAPIAKELIPAVLEFVKALASVAWATIQGFFNGLKSMAEPISKAFKGLADAFSNLAKSLGGSEGAFKSVGEFLGKLAGGAVAFGLKVLADAINFLAAAFALLSGNLEKAGELFDKLNVVKWANDQAKGFENWVNNLVGIKQLTEKTKDALGLSTDKIFYYAPDVNAPGAQLLGTLGYAVRSMDKYAEDLALQKSGKSIQTAHDVVITKKGDIVKLDPADTIRASKGPGGMGGNVSVSVQLNVTEGSARAAGIAFAGGLADQLRNTVLAEQVAGGYQ